MVLNTIRPVRGWLNYYGAFYRTRTGLHDGLRRLHWIGNEISPSIQQSGCPASGLSDTNEFGETMSMNQQLAYYVVTHYARFMNSQERLAYGHLAGAMKATLGRSDTSAQEEARHSPTFSRMLSNDSAVLTLASGGYEAFLQQTATRILNEHRDKVFLNYCARCGKLARTPKAKQCRSCGYDWHDVPS